ncbi:MAG TPA: hypothetical protein VHN11_11670 [Xanthobacteraceae bacterium]|jgi:hypothetical protein|nr:hypothetical protein [Xanthobacteraceae bacterium]
MDQATEALLVDFLEWVGKEPRTRTDVMDVWRTSCPRLPIWEEATDRKFVSREKDQNSVALVTLTAEGHKFLQQHQPAIMPKAVKPTINCETPKLNIRSR